MIDLPLSLITAFLLIGSVYFILGFNFGVDHFFKAVANSILLRWNGLFMGIIFSSAFQDTRLAYEVIPLISGTFMLFSGLFINLGYLIRLSFHCFKILAIYITGKIWF